MGADKLAYDSTGAGEMVHSNDSQVDGGWSSPGGNAIVPSVPTGDVGGIGNVATNKMAPRQTPPSNGGPERGFASDGGNQRIP